MSKLKPFIGGVVVSAIVVPLLGFTALGWRLDSKAQNMAQEAANAAVKEALVPICVARFKADPEVTAHMAALKAKEYSYPRVEYIRSGGWATLPGQAEPSTGIANACANALVTETH